MYLRAASRLAQPSLLSVPLQLLAPFEWRGANRRGAIRALLNSDVCVFGFLLAPRVPFLRSHALCVVAARGCMQGCSMLHKDRARAACSSFADFSF